MNTLIFVIKNLIQINLITALLAVLAFVAIREQQAATTENNQKLLSEAQTYTQQPVQNNFYQFSEDEQSRKVAGLLESNSVPPSPNPKPKQTTSQPVIRPLAKSSNIPVSLTRTNPVIQFAPNSSKIPPEIVKESNGLLNSNRLSLGSQNGNHRSRQNPLKPNSHQIIEVNSSTADYTLNLAIAPGSSELMTTTSPVKPTAFNSQVISSDHLTFDNWNTLLLQPFQNTTTQDSEMTLTIKKTTDNEELITETNPDGLALASPETELPIAQVSTRRGNPRIEKDTSIRYANDIAYGLIIAGENGQINYKTTNYKKVQTAIKLLRRGEDLYNAARRAGIEVAVLQQLIKWGENRPGSIATLPKRNEFNLR